LNFFQKRKNLLKKPVPNDWAGPTGASRGEPLRACVIPARTRAGNRATRLAPTRHAAFGGMPAAAHPDAQGPVHPDAHACFDGK